MDGDHVIPVGSVLGGHPDGFDGITRGQFHQATGCGGVVVISGTVIGDGERSRGVSRMGLVEGTDDGVRGTHVIAVGRGREMGLLLIGSGAADCHPAQRGVGRWNRSRGWRRDRVVHVQVDVDGTAALRGEGQHFSAWS